MGLDSEIIRAIEEEGSIYINCDDLIAGISGLKSALNEMGVDATPDIVLGALIAQIQRLVEQGSNEFI